MCEVDEETQMLMDEYPQRDTAFTAYILSEIAELINMGEYRVEHFDCPNKALNVIGEIYGYYLSESKEVLTLVYTVYDSTSDHEVKTLTNSDYQKAINRLQGFYNLAIRGLCFDLEERGETKTAKYEISKEIYDNMSNFTSVRLLVLSNSVINNYEIKNIRIHGKAVFPEVWDINKIYANLHSGKDHAEIDVDFTNEYKSFKIPFIEMESNDFGYKCIVALFPGKLLYQLYEKHNTDLLLNNVRYFLGFKGAKKTNANRGILDTLKNESQMFLAYNNGITALAESIESENIGNRTDVSEDNNLGNNFISVGMLKAIRDFRIVNGGQTTASIFHAKNKDNNIVLQGVYVQVKIIVLAQDFNKIAGNITKFSNSQSKIKYADFTISNNFNMTLQELSRNIMAPNKNNEPLYWYFERVRGQYDQEKKQNTTKETQSFFNRKYPKDKKFKKEEIAKVWKSWMQEPFDAVKGEATNYEMFITQNENTTPDENYFKKSVALLIIYRFLMSRPECKQYGNRKATVVTYTIAYLNYITFGKLDLDKIWNQQGLSDELTVFLNQLSESINDAVINLAAEMSVLSWGKRKQSFKELTNYGLKCNVELIKNDMD